ncbi:MAG TPA: hypothetical protein VH234_01790 [Candidatus Saccharimonadales bacterium]|nr:hypothetical protein [Candidatus Saccharimonadales bacterium]
MVSTLLIVAIAALALGLGYSLLRNAHLAACAEQDALRDPSEIDVEIFRVLLDRDQELQLHQYLTTSQFDTFERRRVRIALRMLRLVDDNTGMLMQRARLAKIKNDSEVAVEMDRIIGSALQLRLSLILARCCLYLKWLFPSWTLFLPAFDVRYQHLLDSMYAPGGAIA